MVNSLKVDWASSVYKSKTVLKQDQKYKETELEN